MGKKKELSELTITDDFMFGAVMSDPKRCKPLLELILGIKIQKIEYPELQKTIDKLYDSKSIRLDVYVEDDKNTVYNVEIQTTEKRNLPKRTRYYQGIIDLNILEKGWDYTSLRKSYVIFICTYDPYGKGKYVYRFENRCLEDFDLPLGDDTFKIILNTKGMSGGIDDELKKLLRFMDGMEPESDYARELEKAVAEVKESEEWRRKYMVMMERDRGNIRLGEYKEKVATVRALKGRYRRDDLAMIIRIKPAIVSLIIRIIEEHPDWDDEEIAENIDFEKL